MPITDDDLRLSAYRLADAMIAMLRRDGLDPDIPGYPDQKDADVFVRSFEIDAEMYMSMNLEALGEEFNEVRNAARAIKEEGDPNGVVRSLHEEVETAWHGEAAVAFTNQLYRIERCVDAQYEYTKLAAHTVTMMYAVNAQFRASCRDLMEKTADKCDAIAVGQDSSGVNWAAIGTSLAKAVIDGIKSADPSKLREWAVDQLLGYAVQALESKPVDGADALPVVEGYLTAREELFASYEDNLEQVRTWIDGRRDELAASTTTIPEPLPASADVDSPDFRYERFAHGTHQFPGDFAPEVQRERQKFVAEKAKPDGVITHGLSGER
jgi:hypothetical protein